MKELSAKEERWLEIFSKESDFFESLLRFYKKNDYLTYKQYSCLIRDINEWEEEGDTILDQEDLKFLEEYSENNEELMELLEIYEDKGYLDEYEYNYFIELKVKSTKKQESSYSQKELSENFTIKSETRKIDVKHTIIKIPYPHCGFLCSSQLSFCGKCGEPLPEIDIINEVKETPKAVHLEINKTLESLKLKELLKFLNEKFLTKDLTYEEVVYILRLENNKWWIGKTKYILGMIEKFKKGKVNNWIKQNLIVSIEDIIENGDIVSITLNYMEKYGWQNVQGSSWYEGQPDKYIPYKIKKYVSEQKRKNIFSNYDEK